MFIKGFSSKRKIGSVPVYLNVYDLTPINGYAYWLGLGIYHSGVQVHDVEYAFGAHEYPTTGIFEGEPRQCPGFTFRKSILIGRTDLGPKEVREFMEKLAEEYTGNMYHLITKNCNHFCDDACLRLTGKPIPRWVNRLAKLGLLCICVLPIGLHPVTVSHKLEDRVCDGERKKLRSNSSRYISPPAPAATSEGGSVPSIASVTRSRRRRSEPWLLFICVLLVAIHPAAIGHRSEDRVCDGERKKLRSNSSRYISPPAPASTSEGGSVHHIASATRSRRRWSEPCVPSLVTASLTLKL